MVGTPSVLSDDDGASSLAVRPIASVPVGEIKAQKFERLANLKTNQLLDLLRRLGNLSNKNRNEY